MSANHRIFAPVRKQGRSRISRLEETRLTARNNNRGSRIATPSYQFQPSINSILRKAMFSTGSTWLEGEADTKLDQSRVFLTMAYRPIQFGAVNRTGIIEIQCPVCAIQAWAI